MRWGGKLPHKKTFPFSSERESGEKKKQKKKKQPTLGQGVLEHPGSGLKKCSEKTFKVNPEQEAIGETSRERNRGGKQPRPVRSPAYREKPYHTNSKKGGIRTERPQPLKDETLRESSKFPGQKIILLERGRSEKEKA